MNGIGRRRRLPAGARAQDNPTVTLERGIPAEATAARLAELERIHADELAAHRQLASDHRALLDALHARSPEEWHQGEPATSALSYLRHLEDEADRCGIDRRPPWAQQLSAEPTPVLATVFRDHASWAYALDPNASPPPRTAPQAEGDTKPVPEVTPPPAGEEAGCAAPQASPVTSGTASSEDGPLPGEPAAEQDCGETGDAA